MLSKLNLTNDYLFCRLFGDRGNRDILLSLVNAVLEDKGFPKLLGVRLINPTLYGDTIRAKTGILDLHAVDDEGRRYDIEIQVKNELNYIKRSIFYLARMYHQQLLRGKNYGTLKPCISINILDFILFPVSHLNIPEEDKEEYHFYYTLQGDNKYYAVLSDDIGLHYIELPKINFTSSSLTLLQKWLYYIKNAGKLEDTMIQKIRSEVKEIDMASREWKKLTANQRATARAIRRQKARLDYHDSMHNAEARGRAAGIEQARLELAQKLKAEGFSNEKILELTGVSLE